MDPMLRCVAIVLGAAAVGLLAWDASDSVMFGGARSIPAEARRVVAAVVRMIDQWAA